jgi:hypothetical protein
MDEEKFKKLIQRGGLDEPGPSFTDNIMKLVESQEDLSLKPALLSVLKNELLTDPSPGFSDKLMSHILPKASKIAAPIITKKITLIISGFGISILLLVVINLISNTNDIQNSYSTGLKFKLSGAMTAIAKIANSVLVYFVPLSILLFLDYFFRTRPISLATKA